MKPFAHESSDQNHDLHEAAHTTAIVGGLAVAATVGELLANVPAESDVVAGTSAAALIFLGHALVTEVRARYSH